MLTPPNASTAFGSLVQTTADRFDNRKWDISLGGVPYKLIEKPQREGHKPSRYIFRAAIYDADWSSLDVFVRLAKTPEDPDIFAIARVFEVTYLNKQLQNEGLTYVNPEITSSFGEDLLCVLAEAVMGTAKELLTPHWRTRDQRRQYHEERLRNENNS